MSNKIKAILISLAAVIVGILCGVGVGVNIKSSESEAIETVITVDTGSSLELSEEQVPAVIENEEGELEEVDIPTIEEVDGGQMQTEEGEVVDDITSARGAYYNTETWQDFVTSTENKCVIEGNIYGAQCVSLAQAFWTNYAGRNITTCGTGAAFGIFNEACRSRNAGDDFEIIYNATEVQAGDWLVFSGGLWGHIGMAEGPYNNGYIALYGENQGGTACEQGGSQPNTINISAKNFLGAYRPKTYIIPEPEPEPEAPDTGVAK